jgi:hypothetical protein
MKTITAIIIMLVSFSTIAQDGWKEANIHDNTADVYPFLKQGAITGAVTSAVSYEILFKKTKLDQNACRLISIGVGSLSAFAYNYLVPEKKLSNISRFYGAAFASITFNVSIGFDRKRDLKRNKWKY